MKMILLLIILAILLIPLVPLYGTPPSHPHPFKIKLDVIEHPKGPGPVELELSVGLKPEYVKYEEVTFTAKTFRGLEFIGAETWNVHISVDKPYNTILHVNIPPNDTSNFRIEMVSKSNPNDCKVGRGTAAQYFVAKEDTVEVYPGRPQAYIKRGLSIEEKLALWRSNFTQEELNREFDVKVTWMARADHEREIITRLVDNLTPSEQDGVYTGRTTWDGVLELRARRFLATDVLEEDKSRIPIPKDTLLFHKKAQGRQISNPF